MMLYFCDLRDKVKRSFLRCLSFLWLVRFIVSSVLYIISCKLLVGGFMWRHELTNCFLSRTNSKCTDQKQGTSTNTLFCHIDLSSKPVKVVSYPRMHALLIKLLMTSNQIIIFLLFCLGLV